MADGGGEQIEGNGKINNSKLRKEKTAFPVA